MPAGYPRVDPLPLCHRHGCRQRVQNYRQRYCSRACFGRAVNQRPARVSQKGRGITIAKEDAIVSKPSFWPGAQREGFTALCASQKFSSSRKTLVLHHASFGDL